jgi:hypothetical protein
MASFMPTGSVTFAFGLKRREKLSVPICRNGTLVVDRAHLSEAVSDELRCILLSLVKAGQNAAKQISRRGRALNFVVLISSCQHIP